MPAKDREKTGMAFVKGFCNEKRSPSTWACSHLFIIYPSALTGVQVDLYLSPPPLQRLEKGFNISLSYPAIKIVLKGVSTLVYTCLRGTGQVRGDALNSEGVCASFSIFWL
jgi:hypothetical protein